MRIASSNAPIKKAFPNQQQPKPATAKPGPADETSGQDLQGLVVDVAAGRLFLVPAQGEAVAPQQAPQQASVSQPTQKFELRMDVAKALDEERYTFGPLYTPDEVDAHGEYVRPAQLTKAMRDFARSGVRTVNKQHKTGMAPIGDIVDWVVWPYEQEVDLQLPGREIRKAVLPAGTAYVGVVWSPQEWPSVKGGAITGYSLGGRAMRVQTGEILPPSRR